MRAQFYRILYKTVKKSSVLFSVYFENSFAKRDSFCYSQDGDIHPPNLFSKNSAIAKQSLSWNGAAITWIPIGKPWEFSPNGTFVAGRLNAEGIKRYINAGNIIAVL